MRKELLKSDERIEKIAEDPRKMAFLKAIEDLDDEEEGYGGGDDEPEPETTESQSQEAPNDAAEDAVPQPQADPAGGILQPAPPSTTNRRLPAPLRRTTKPSSTTVANNLNKKPASLTEIRESLSFLIEEPDSQASLNGPLSPPASDSETEHPNGYDSRGGKENADDEYDEVDEDDDDDDMADFIVEDSQPSASASHKAEAVFKKPAVPPPRLPGPQRRTKAPISDPNSNPRTDVVDRLSLLRQRSSSSSSSSISSAAAGGSRMAFLASNGSAGLGSVPSLLRRATTNSSFGSEGGGGGGTVTTERQIAEEAGKKRVFGGGGGGRGAAGGMKGSGNGAGAGAGAGAVNYRGRMKGAGVREKHTHHAVGGVEKTSVTAKGKGKKGTGASGAGTGGFLKGFLGGSWD